MERQKNLFETGEVSKNISKAECLANDFGVFMQKSEKVYDTPKSEERIKFLIGVFLAERKELKRKELNSEKALELIDQIYNLHLEKRKEAKSSFEAPPAHSEPQAPAPTGKKREINDPYLHGLEKKYRGMGLYD